MYDIKTSTPAFLYISNAKMHDVNALDLVSYEPSGYYVYDKTYLDSKRLYHTTSSELSLLQGQKITCDSTGCIPNRLIRQLELNMIKSASLKLSTQAETIQKNFGELSILILKQIRNLSSFQTA